METYRILMLHLGILATVGAGILVVRLTVKFNRAIQLMLELRQMEETI
jgi:hypothetical protein